MPATRQNTELTENDPTSGGVDPLDLKRFTSAQAGVYAQALSELRSGRKRTHWMWFIFPQFAGLGHSSTSIRYAIKSLEEARQYLKHPVLGLSGLKRKYYNVWCERRAGRARRLRGGHSQRLCPRVENAARPDAPPHPLGTARFSPWTAFHGAGHTFGYAHVPCALSNDANHCCQTSQYLRFRPLRLLECAEAVLAVAGRSVSEIFGYPDDLKLKSSMTLFACVAEQYSVFGRVLDKHFQGERDARTLQLLDQIQARRDSK